MNKGGQFFLMAALIIVGALIGLTSVANYVHTTQEKTQLADLGREIGFEARQVLDYGVYNEQDSALLLQSLISNYSSYVAQDQVVFVYGNASNLSAYTLVERQVGVVGIDTGGDTPTAVPLTISQGARAEVQTDDEDVVVSVNNIEYRFRLREGQNFYFVLIREENDDRFVATG